jgi:hypothetical protein
VSCVRCLLQFLPEHKRWRRSGWPYRDMWQLECVPQCARNTECVPRRNADTAKPETAKTAVGVFGRVGRRNVAATVTSGP